MLADELEKRVCRVADIVIVRETMWLWITRSTPSNTRSFA